MKKNIFYSWQSDLPNNLNRGFIETSLEKTIKEIAGNINLEIAIDRDTKNTPGAADISKTIFAKIKASDVFVADVSIINPKAKTRKTPNPNVLIELGYAAKCLGWENIICVFNLAYGKVDELPFDIRFRTILTYKIDKPENKKEPRELLSKLLRNQILLIFQKQRTTNEILKHIKLDIDKEMFSLGRVAEKIIYGYEGLGTIKRFYQSLGIDSDTLRKNLSGKTFIGFQIFKDYSVEKKQLEEKIKNPFLINNIPDEWVNSLLKVIRSLEFASLVNSSAEHFTDTGKIDENFTVLRASDLNSENPPNSFLLLEKVNEKEQIVRDSGQFKQYYQKRLLTHNTINDQWSMMFSDSLHKILNSINEWVSVTGGYLILDPASIKF